MSQRYLLTSIYVIIALMSVSGCSSFVADRTQGFNMIQQGFSSLKPTPGLHQEIEIKSIKLVIIGDREQFQWKKAAAPNSPIIGYATPDNEIWIFGKRVNGKIVVNEAVLGHEITHLLSFQNASIANPDHFAELNTAR
jgi:hypothetical protein